MQAIKEVLETAATSLGNAISTTTKDRDLAANTIGEPTKNDVIRTNFGTKITDTDNSLKAGPRGPILLEDFHFREKMTHFDHERIPERVVHARGNAAHGYFQVYEPLQDLTKADFLLHPAKRTPVFVRFSTVAGSRGSADTVRDVRGFAVKFYTDEGNFDLVGNNIPVFFIQDAIKFPDVVHAVKPEPHNEIPQAQSAHDNFWDFVSLVPETSHMIMWIMSDRALPRSYRMIQGFGVHTFILVNAEGRRTFVKFHWLPLLGTHSLTWDESLKLAGVDPDWLRRDLWEAIETGNYPEWELGIQVLEESDEHKFDFDILDATKIIPEELVPIRRIGKMVLNRNPDNYFAETEQVAYCTSHLVPGIEASNDPLLQGRNFSYQDTQLTRLGGPNFEEIPINRPVCPYMNNQRDGFHRMAINKGRVNYFPNRFSAPNVASPQDGYEYSKQKIEGMRERMRGAKFSEHFKQARLFYNSLSVWEKKHLMEALQFELAHCTDMGVRERVVNNILNKIDLTLAQGVATAIGVTPPNEFKGLLHSEKSAPLSQEVTVKDSIATRKIGFILAPGFNAKQYKAIAAAVKAAGGMPLVIGPHLGAIKSDTDGINAEVDFIYVIGKSVMFDSIVLVGGQAHISVLGHTGVVIASVLDAFKHGKAIAAVDEGVEFLEGLKLPGITLAKQGEGVVSSLGVVTSRAFNDAAAVFKGDAVTFGTEYFRAIASHRHPLREVDMVPS